MVLALKEVLQLVSTLLLQVYTIRTSHLPNLVPLLAFVVFQSELKVALPFPQWAGMSCSKFKDELGKRRSFIEEPLRKRKSDF
jgi:hypothetical protein